MHEALNIRRWHNYFAAGRDLCHILLANIGLLKQPDHAAMYDRFRAYIELLWDVPSKMRIVGGENVSRDVPTVFASNHIKLDDPILIGYAVHVATDGRHAGYMMRSDFFGRKWYMKTKLLDLDELPQRFGAILVDRDNPRPGQLRPFIRLLCGGGAFVIAYLVCILLVGIPILVAEVMIGRQSRKNPVGAFHKLSSGNKLWITVGFLGVASGFVILSYYSVVAGWTLDYFTKSVSGAYINESPDTINKLFGDLLGDPIVQPRFAILIG